jgi:hypothetical protein
MGKVTLQLAKIRETSNFELMKRFKHIVGAQAIREYIAAKPDLTLKMEVRLMTEEIDRRMDAKRSFILTEKKARKQKVVA